MSMYNILKITMCCPHCGNLSLMDAEFRFGFLNLDTYKVGDTINWGQHGRGLRFPKQRPTNGNYTSEGYIVCPVCQKDFWVVITVGNDQFEQVDYDPSKPGYI